MRVLRALLGDPSQRLLLACALGGVACADDRMQPAQSRPDASAMRCDAATSAPCRLRDAAASHDGALDAAFPRDAARASEDAGDITADAGLQPAPIVGDDYVDFGERIAAADGTLALQLDVPSDALSFVLSADPGSVPRMLALLELRDPDDELIFDAGGQAPQAFEPLSRTSTNEATPYVVMLPSSPEHALVPGSYRILLGIDALGRDARAPVHVDVVFARGREQQAPRSLSLIVWTLAGSTLSAADAAADPDLRAAFDRMGQIYATAGLELGDIDYRELDGDGIAELDRLDDDVELAALLALLARATSTEHALHLILIDEFATEPGKTVLAKVSSLPGPPPHAALARRGALVVARSTLPSDPQRAGALLAHESAHYFGLRHTSEYDGVRHDPIADTPECPAQRASLTSAGIAVLSAEDCADLDGDNLLFYTPPQGDLVQEALSEGQRYVLSRYPLLR